MQSVPSPNRRWIATVDHVEGTTTGRVEVSRTGTDKQTTLYASNDSCCTNLLWATPRLIAFDDDYTVRTIDVITHRTRLIASFSNFVVSKDGRWVAGWKNTGGHSPAAIGVISITGTDCHQVPKPKDADDWNPRFSADGKRLLFRRQRFDPHEAQDVAGTAQTLSIPLSKLKPSSFGRLVC